ncbi:DUF1844 domain-containing protein [Bremerella cremea]|uniref:DUF1844 domain-containing protein n=1 Tax=Bremerella cremea TaxID=1031537 RepID=UPI0031EFF07E
MSEDHDSEKKNLEEQPAEGGSPGPMPPADFTLLISMLATQAFSALGLMPDPVTGQTSRNPEVAKHMIDLLGMLEAKTKGNLEPHESAALESILHQIRMAYVSETK